MTFLHTLLLGESSLVRDASVEAQRVQGWLVAPRSIEPQKRAPLVVLVHGGPAAAVTPSFSTRLWGQNEISDWLVPYFGATVYDDPKSYARSSPIEFIKHAKTPTLLIVGERDGECPTLH
jgi:dipeptidyl aminopeptidase/acylaminoacyl peptidase